MKMFPLVLFNMVMHEMITATIAQTNAILTTLAHEQRHMVA
jgi:hypothetical protein